MVMYIYIYILMGIHLQMVYLSPNLAELLSHGLVKHDTSASSILVFSRSNEDLDAVRDWESSESPKNDWGWPMMRLPLNIVTMW